MSFLDNLESNLKSLESRDERSPADNRRRDSERARTLAEAPWARRLKESPYTRRLLSEATRAGHKLRAKVYIAWIDTTLRLECRERKLELRPSPNGVTAAFLENNLESKSEPVDLDGNPEDLVQRWLA
ncbi:MAG: hypothetical protein M3Z23_06280 [Acidobacteriota bacterium]|nr:hypothetical protein [Acidobacteriota bacterium]